LPRSCAVKPPRKIGKSGVRIPDGFFKVVYDETPPCKMIAFIAPDENIKQKPRALAVSVDEVERLTGFDFFAKLPDAEEKRLESAADFTAW